MSEVSEILSMSSPSEQGDAHSDLDDNASNSDGDVLKQLTYAYDQGDMSAEDQEAVLAAIAADEKHTSDDDKLTRAHDQAVMSTEDQEAVLAAIAADEKQTSDAMAGLPVPLAERTSQAANHFMGPRARFTHIAIPNEADDEDELIPTGHGKHWDSASLKLRIQGGSQCPTLRILVTVEEANVRTAYPMHTAELIFPRASITSLTAIAQQIDTEYGHVIIDIGTDGGIGFKLEARDAKFDQTTIQILNILEGSANIQVGQIFRRETVYDGWTCNTKYEPIELVKYDSETSSEADSNTNKQIGTRGAEKKDPANDEWGVWGESEHGNSISDTKSEILEHDKSGQSEAVSEPNVLEIEGIVDVSATDAFIDVQEGCIKLVYGESTEERIAELATQSFQGKASQVFFSSVKDTVLKAHIRMPQDEHSADLLPRVSKGTWVRMGLLIQGQEKEKSVLGFTVNPAWGPAYGNLLLVVVGTPAKFFAANNLLTQSLTWMAVDVEVIDNKAGLKRQISAMNEMLCNEAAQPFHRVFLNHGRSNRETSDLVKLSGLSEEEIKTKKEKVLSRAELNQEQLAAFNSMRNLKDFVAIIQGYPGTGKTQLIAAMAVFLASIDIHVACGAATHDATDNLIEKIMDLMEDFTDPILDSEKPVRVYRPIQEESHLFKNKGDAVNDTTEKIGDFETNDDLEAVSESLLLSVLQDLKLEQSRKAFNHAELSLQERCVSNAFEAELAGATLMVPYSGKKDDGQSPLDPVDMFAEFRSFFHKLHEAQAFQNWDIETKNHFKQAWEQVRDHTMKRTKLLVATTNTLRSEYVRQYFGHEAKAIALFLDEASMERESNSWTFLNWTKLSKVKALFLVGDIAQPEPTVISAYAKTPFNEFARQLKTSLQARLLRQGIPSYALRIQYRMHPDISAQPSVMTYNGKLQNDPTCETLLLAIPFQNVLKEFIGLPLTSRTKINVITVNVTDGECVIHPATLSRSNLANIRVGMEFIRKLHAADALEEHDIKIITTYSYQRGLWLDELFRFSVTNRVPLSKLPTVFTCTSIRGRQADFVLFDSVLSIVNSLGDLGLAQDDKLMNVVHTRARRGMMTLYNHRITKGVLVEKHKFYKDKSGRGLQEFNPLPYLFGMLNFRAAMMQKYDKKGSDV